MMNEKKHVLDGRPGLRTSASRVKSKEQLLGERSLYMEAGPGL